jgi:hypothetical protein
MSKRRVVNGHIYIWTRRGWRLVMNGHIRTRKGWRKMRRPPECRRQSAAAPITVPASDRTGGYGDTGHPELTRHEPTQREILLRDTLERQETATSAHRQSFGRYDVLREERGRYRAVDSVDGSGCGRGLGEDGQRQVSGKEHGGKTAGQWA